MKRLVRGLTLVELLVAFGILTLIVAAVQAAFSAALRSWTKADYVVQATAVGRLALEQMAREIGCAMVDAAGGTYYCVGYDGPSGMRSGSKADEFYCIAARNPGDSDFSDLCEVGYWCDGQRTASLRDDALNRFYVRDDRGDAGSPRYFDFDFATGGSNEFAAMVTDLQFTYFDRSGAAFTSWDSRVRNGPPRRIQISVTVLAGAGTPTTTPDYYRGTFTTSVVLPAGG